MVVTAILTFAGVLTLYALVYLAWLKIMTK
jgi:hypothetical protein